MPIKRFLTSHEGQYEPGIFQGMIDAIEVEYIEPNVYMSRQLWQIAGARATFGGQFIAQSMRAAFYTVPEQFHIHSLHCYFLLPGSLEHPVYYKVQPIRDGRSFCTRSVTAVQNGKVAFVSQLSFTTNSDSDDTSLMHQTPMPEIVDPEELLSESKRWESYISDELSDQERDYLIRQKEDIQPMEFRDEKVYSAREFVTGHTTATNHHRRWFKARGKLGDDPRLHACAVAYASDSRFVMTPALVHGLTYRGLGMMASIDHAMWFHGPVRADEWLVHDMESPRANNGRGVSFGKIYTQEGVLVATTAQEGIVRLPKNARDKRLDKRSDTTPETDDVKSISVSKL